MDVTSASAVALNENYLFFTGSKATGATIDSTGLFIQKKQGAGLYYHYDQDDSVHLLSPAALLTFKDTLLLVANEGFISMLDMTKFPPLASDFRDTDLAVT